MKNEEFAIILKHINLMIDQGTASPDSEDLIDALDQIQKSIEFYLRIMEE